MASSFDIKQNQWNKIHRANFTLPLWFGPSAPRCTVRPINDLSEEIKIPLYMNNLIVQTTDIFVIFFGRQNSLLTPCALLTLGNEQITAYVLACVSQLLLTWIECPTKHFNQQITRGLCGYFQMIGGNAHLG